MDRYRDAAIGVCDDMGVLVVRADVLVEPLGPAAFATDGLHLSGAGYRVIVPAIANALDSLIKTDRASS